jgi:hypothetical protein
LNARPDECRGHPAGGSFVSYLLRVSTDRQERSGLGLEAQRKAVTDYLAGGGSLVAELVEVESGARDTRPRLDEALALCRLHNATLVIAKLDRLSQDAHFLLGLKKAGVRFAAADMPEANELVVGIMAVVAQTGYGYSAWGSNFCNPFAYPYDALIGAVLVGFAGPLPRGGSLFVGGSCLRLNARSRRAGSR